MSVCGICLFGLFLLLFPEFTAASWNPARQLTTIVPYLKLQAIFLTILLQTSMFSDESFSYHWRLPQTRAYFSPRRFSRVCFETMHFSSKSFKNVVFLSHTQLQNLSCSLITSITLTKYEFYLVGKSRNWENLRSSFNPVWSHGFLWMNSLASRTSVTHGLQFK